MNRRSNRRLRGFAVRLDESINQSNLSYSELSRRLNCNVKSIYAWRDGLYEPTVFDLAQLCVQLNVDADFLLFGITKENVNA